MAAEEVGVHGESLAVGVALSAAAARRQVEDADAAVLIVLEGQRATTERDKGGSLRDMKSFDASQEFTYASL